MRKREREGDNGRHGNTAQVYTRSVPVDRGGNLTREKERDREKARESRHQLRDSISIICRFVDSELCDYAPPRPPPLPPITPAVHTPTTPFLLSYHPFQNRVSDYLHEIDFTCLVVLYLYILYTSIVLPPFIFISAKPNSQ